MNCWNRGLTYLGTPEETFSKSAMLSALVLAALVKLNLAIEKPVVPAIIFALFAFVIGFLFGYPFLAVAIAAPINFGLSFLYFWLLKRTEGEGSWWMVLFGGLFVFIGLSFIKFK